MSRKWAIDVEDVNTKEKFMVFFEGDRPPSDEQQKKAVLYYYQDIHPNVNPSGVDVNRDSDDRYGDKLNYWGWQITGVTEV